MVWEGRRREAGPAISQPRIYFGESAAGYVIVKGGTPEFDYPKGQDNSYTRYDGADGVPIGGTAWRSLFAWYFGRERRGTDLRGDAVFRALASMGTTQVRSLVDPRMCE